jgi:polyhydroxyalkanoate synthesis regulator phasin
MFISDWEHEKNALILEDLQEEIKSLETKNTDLLKEWCIQAVECQELEKEIEKLKKQLANLSNRLNT